MDYDLLLSNGLVYVDGGFMALDVGIKGEKIAALMEHGSNSKAEKVIDVTGKYVLPGLIDFHCHVFEPGPNEKREFYDTGTMAAANGGLTMICTMPNGCEGGLASPEAYSKALERAEKKAVIDYNIIASPLGFQDGYTQQLADMGSAFFKLLIKDQTAPLNQSFACGDFYTIAQCFKAIAKTGRYCSVHPRDISYMNGLKKHLMETEPELDLPGVFSHLFSEEEMAASAWQIAFYARKYNMKWHALHCWMDGYIDLVRMLKAEGRMDIIASVEMLPINGRSDYLYDPETGEVMLHLGHCALPNYDHVWKAVADGTIDLICSDHSPNSMDFFKPETPWNTAKGVCGLDWFGHLLLDEVYKGNLSLERLVQTTSENGAKAFGFYDRKGSNLPGTDADFSIADLNETWVVGKEKFYTNGRLSPYYGQTIHGKFTHTIVRGQVVMDHGEILVKPGYGKMIVPAENC